MENGVEIIDFNLPLGDGKSILLHGIPWKRSMEELKFAIEARYRQFGPIHSIVVRKDSKGSNEASNYKAFVNYYSSGSALEARAHKIIVRGTKPLSVSKGHGFSQGRPLNSQECIQLANYYFGFNGWSHSILYHRPELLDPEDSGPSSQPTLHWICVVQVHVGGRQVEGVAKEPVDPNTEPSEKGLSFGRAQKSVTRSALGNALRKLLIIVCKSKDTSKVKVEVDRSVKDPFYYDPLWEKTNLEELATQTL